MPTPSNLVSLVIFIAGLIVFFDCFKRILDEFSKHTAWPISVGVVFMGAGALAFLHDPYWLGGLIIIGRALQVLTGSQIRFSDRSSGRSTLR